MFEAVATVHHDSTEKQIKIHAFRDLGVSKLADLTLNEKGFVWGFDFDQRGKIRYTVTLTDDTWHEIGEFIQPGQPPATVLEMNLKRVAKTPWLDSADPVQLDTAKKSKRTPGGGSTPDRR